MRKYNLWHQFAFHPDLTNEESFMMLIIIHCIRTYGKATATQVNAYFNSDESIEALNGLERHGYVKVEEGGRVKTYAPIKMVDIPDVKMKRLTWQSRLGMLRRLQFEIYAQTHD